MDSLRRSHRSEFKFFDLRVTKIGWLGRPQIGCFPWSIFYVLQISTFRVIIGIVLLIVVLNHDARRLQRALSALSFLFAALDWIPYMACTWRRQPTILTKWVTPLSGVASVLLNTVWVLVTVDDRPGSPPNQYWGGLIVRLMALLTAVCGAVLMNLSWLYFVHYGPIKLPPRYEPVCMDSKYHHESEESAAAGASGPLATLYEAQKRSNSHAGERRTDGQTTENNPIANRQTTSSAHFNSSLFFWREIKRWKVICNAACITGMSMVHMALHILQYDQDRWDGESCGRACVLHLVYPPLWMLLVLIVCILIKARIDFQRQLLGPLTVLTILYAVFLAIVVVWTIDSVIILTSTTGFVSNNDRFFTWWWRCNILPLLFMLALVVKGSCKKAWSFAANQVRNMRSKLLRHRPI
ncbi:hypothetical protein F5884DRAFT_785238, partial [Xylogone sp. PMI_703]